MNFSPKTEMSACKKVSPRKARNLIPQNTDSREKLRIPKRMEYDKDASQKFQDTPQENQDMHLEKMYSMFEAVFNLQARI
uniref:Uncharacterized protein n=1 Tax=Romanomermis culicivorax TaxID=13658 RepID=A0A915IIC0_ROMCU